MMVNNTYFPSVKFKGWIEDELGLPKGAKLLKYSVTDKNRQTSEKQPVINCLTSISNGKIPKDTRVTLIKRGLKTIVAFYTWNEDSAGQLNN